MEASFQLIDIIIIIGICQGFFLALTLQRITDNNKSANSMLSLLIIIATAMLIGRFLYVRYWNLPIFQWSLLFDSLIFLFGPLLFLYTSRLLFQVEKRRLAYVHFTPFIAMLIMSLFCGIAYTAQGYYTLFADGHLNYLFTGISALGILSNGYYLWRSYLLLRRYKKGEKHAFAFEQSPLQYLHVFFLSIALFLALWLFSFINSTFLERYFKYLGYDSIWIAIPIFIYVIGYFSLKQPALFRMPIEKAGLEKKKRIGEAEAKLLRNKLDSLMENDKIFLQAELTLVEVANKLQTSTNNISWLLNNSYNETFYDFINSYRIKEFIAKLTNKEHLQHTILALSMDVGFNSKSTFNRAFKIAMNDTPSNYIKTLSAA